MPAGTIIDGEEDPSYPNGDVGSEITSGWDQVDSSHGGIVFFFAETIDVPGPVKSFFWDNVGYDDGTGSDPSPGRGVIGGNGFHLLYVGDTDPSLGGSPGQFRFTYWPLPADSGNVGEGYAETRESPLQTTISQYP